MIERDMMCEEIDRLYMQLREQSRINEKILTEQ